MALLWSIAVFLVVVLSGVHPIEGTYCSSSYDCYHDSDYTSCCNDNQCCSYTRYNNEIFDDTYESGLQLATGVVVAIVVVCILAIIGCVVGCVFCCRQSNAHPGRVLRPPVAVTTHTVQAGYSGVPAQQAGYNPGQVKMQYPAPAYPQPDQLYQQPGMPPPYSAQAGYQPMPALPSGHETTYPPQPVGPYPSQPPYAPETQTQSHYPTEDATQASAHAGHDTAYPPQPVGPYPSQPPYAPETQNQSHYPTEDATQASAPPAF